MSLDGYGRLAYRLVHNTYPDLSSYTESKHIVCPCHTQSVPLSIFASCVTTA